MTVKELIDVLNGFNQDAIVMREEKDLAADYNLRKVVIYNADSDHVFLEFDDEEEI